jgi:hypothetical protein
LGNCKYRSILRGPFGSPQSYAEYQHLLAEWRSATATTPPANRGTVPVPRDRTLHEIALEFDRYARKRYVHPDGQPTGEAGNFAAALRPLLQLYGHTEAAQVGPKLCGPFAWPWSGQT